MGKAPSLKVGDQLAGRFFNAYGEPIDGGPIPEGREVEIGGPSVNPVRRKQPSELIATGIAGIDLNNTLVKMCIRDRLGPTDVLLDRSGPRMGW